MSVTPKRVTFLVPRQKWAFLAALCFLLAVLLSCKGDLGGGKPMKITAPETGDDIISRSVLDRESTVAEAGVQHILLAWMDLANIYGTGMDNRAKGRSFQQARDEIRSILAELKAGGDWEKLLKQYSEDPLAARGRIYEVHPKAKLTSPFKKLSLRLDLNEVAVVSTKYGFHIVRRVE